MRFMRISAGLVVLAATMVRSEEAPLSLEKKQAQSTHILTGFVRGVYSRDVDSTLYGKGTVVTRSVVEVEVESVEKGKGIEKGDVVYARCWQLKKRGEKGLVPGLNGHSDIPADGERIRAFLAKGNYTPTGQTDNGLSVLLPNGIDKIAAK